MKRRIRLLNKLSPGDVVMLTAAVRDLHRSHPEMFQTSVHTSAGSLWENNPLANQMPAANTEVEDILCAYPLIHRSNRTPHHFIHGFSQDLGNKLGVKIEPTDFKGDIHLSDDEKRWMSQVQEVTRMPVPYWIIGAGGKFDFTAKWWPAERYQQVVDQYVNLDGSQVVNWGGADGCLPNAARITFAGPTLQSASMGTQPAVVFTGTEGLQLQSVAELAGNSFTLVVAACSDALWNVGDLFVPGSGQNGAVAAVAASMAQVTLSEPGGTSGTRLSAQIQGCLCPLTIIYDNKQVKIYCSGQLVASDTNTPPYTVWLPKLIGGYGASGFIGRVAELLFYNRALNDNERQSVESYLQNRY